MSDPLGIRPGDLVQVSHPSFCRYGAHGIHTEADIQGHIGSIGRVVEIEPDDEPTDPPGEWATLDTLPSDELVCVGCLRKFNDGEDDAELIERIKNCRPAKLPALAPITATPVRLSEEVWPAEVWAEIERIQGEIAGLNEARLAIRAASPAPANPSEGEKL